MGVKKKRRYQHQHKTRVLLTSIVCFIIILKLCGFVSDFFGSLTGTRSCSADEFQNFSQVIMPKNYSNFKSLCGGMQGWVSEARFDIDPEDLDIFLESTLIDATTLTNDIPLIVYSSWGDDIQNLSSLRYRIVNDYDNEWLEEVIVDTSNSDVWTVYFTVLGG